MRFKMSVRANTTRHKVNDKTTILQNNRQRGFGLGWDLVDIRKLFVFVEFKIRERTRLNKHAHAHITPAIQIKESELCCEK